MSIYPKLALISMLLKNIVICNFMILVLSGCKAKEHSVTNSTQHQQFRDTVVLHQRVVVRDSIFQRDTLERVRHIIINADAGKIQNTSQRDTLHTIQQINTQQKDSKKWFELPIINSVLLLVLIWILYKQR